MTRRTSHLDTYADEQRAILDRIGLGTADQIDATERAMNDNKQRELDVIVMCRRPPAGPYRAGAWPAKLSSAEVKERAEVDAFVDRELGRPMSIALRFVEQGLQYENFERFAVYAEQYETTYKRKAVAL